LNDPNCFLGYLACDEFAMLKPIINWIESDDAPFLLVVLCSVTHDPYEVPEWFGIPAKDPLQRYQQAIFYTDKFIEAFDVEIARLNLTGKTIFCVVGDHGEAFGEHGLLGHERIAFEEVLRIPWVIRAPFLIQPGTTVTHPVSSVDLTPTLLALLGLNVKGIGLDGIDVIYYPTTQTVAVYNLVTDPLESIRIELPEHWANGVTEQIMNWRNDSVFRLRRERTGEQLLFDSWLCRWTNRVCSAKYRPADGN
jgi:arylsulfatase A-like enzyme